MRSKLFVPGCRPELFSKALASDADSLSLDLEDSVPLERKGEARATIGLALQSPKFAASPKTIIVRVNAFRSSFFEADVAEVVCTRLDLLNVPKIESADDVHAVVKLLSRLETERSLARPIGIVANIESPRGLRCAAEIASADRRVVGLQLGFGDLFEPLGIDRTNTDAIRQVQLAVRLAAGEAGIWAYDAAFADIKDTDGFKAEALAAKRLGFLGKTCIHPSQIALANEIFRPSDEEIAFAHRVVEEAVDAQKRGLGAFTVNGRMIDEPFVRRARAILATARRAASPTN
jgi:citrate lyase subunit beta/citryl-CoA lyase